MRFHRRTAPKVVGGVVQQKNRWRKEPDYTQTHQVRIERFKPRRGLRHFVSPTDVTAFLGLLPNWRELAIGLNRVVLSADRSCQGWFVPGTVAICAWAEECVQILNPGFYADHANLFQLLRVPCRPIVLVKSCAAHNWRIDRAADADPELICAECGPQWYPFSRDTLAEEYDDLTYYDVKENRSKETMRRGFGYLAEFNPAT